MLRERPGRAVRQRNAFLFGTKPASGLSGSSDPLVIGTLVGANFNSTADQAITLVDGTWRITKIRTTGASTSMTTAAAGLYTAAAKAGTAIVAASPVYSGMVNPTDVVECAVANYGNASTTVYFALTTAQGAAATANITVFGSRV